MSIDELILRSVRLSTKITTKKHMEQRQQTQHTGRQRTNEHNAAVYHHPQREHKGSQMCFQYSSTVQQRPTSVIQRC